MKGKINTWCIMVGFALVMMIQIIGWTCYGKAEPVTAVGLNAFLASAILGCLYALAFYHRMGSAVLSFLVVLFIQISITHSPKPRPTDSLFHHAMDEFLEKSVGGWEAFYGSLILLGLMYATMIIAACLTAELRLLFSGRTWGGAVKLGRDTLDIFTVWEEQVLAERAARSKAADEPDEK